MSSSASARQQHDCQRLWVSFSSPVALVLALQKSSLYGCFWVFFPELLFGYAPPPSLCEWDASCQSVPGLGYPTLGFFFSADAAFIVIAIVIMLWKCCSLCSGSCKEWKKESLSKLVEKTDCTLFPSGGFMVRCSRDGKLQLRLGSSRLQCSCQTIPCSRRVCSLSVLRRTNAGGQVCASIWLSFLLLAFLGARVSSCFVGMFWDFGSRSSQLHVLERLWVCSHSWVCSPTLFEVLDRHVLAGSLFWGTGEQATGRVDVPSKDNQQQAAAAKETPFICSFVKSLGGASYVVKFEHQATVARVKQHVALKSGVCVDAFYLVQGRQGASGCVPISVAVWVWADSPRFLGNGCASLVAWMGAGRHDKVVTGAVHLGWEGILFRPK